ncbi:MAG: cation-translocating P-type ATPase [Candidatus Poseidoniaceae archaeon]|nr:cation-translocating P-type ATPase [Candidatus Poseidoniaceae archaeon]
MGRIDVGGMTCAACVSHVENAIMKIPGIDSVAVNLALGKVDFRGEVAIEEVMTAVNSSGYQASIPIDFSKKWSREKQSSDRDFLTSILGLSIALSFMSYFMLNDTSSTELGILALALVLALGGWRVVEKGVNSLRYGLNMYSLVLCAMSAAILWTIYSPENQMWEAAFIVPAFVAFGDALESRARVSATSSFANLAGQRIEGQHKTGDEIQVKAGSIVPVDGQIIKGVTDVEQAAITGESLPVKMSAGDRIWAGSTCIDGSITIRAENDSGSSRLDDVIRMVEKAQSEKATIERTVDRIASIFVPIVLTLAVITFFYWKNEGEYIAIRNAVTVLVIACPCAMGLATPISLFVGTTTGARHGILLKGHRALESASTIEVVVMDKTGTITEGKPIVSCDSEEALQIAAALESHTTHPIADAIVNSCANYPEATEVVTIPGWGVRGRIEGIEHSVGKGKNGVEVHREEILIGTITLEDEVRSDAAASIALLPKVIIASGDSQLEVDRVAAILEIGDARGNLSPEEKISLIDSIPNVAMVGDGINDAAALAKADLGIAVAGASGLADISADIVLMKSGVMPTVDALELAQRTRANIRQNLFWAFAYNTVAIPLAMGVAYPWTGWYLPPMAAAAAMSLSSVTVVMNALRLRWSFERSVGRRAHGE